MQFSTQYRAQMLVNGTTFYMFLHDCQECAGVRVCSQAPAQITARAIITTPDHVAVVTRTVRVFDAHT